MPSIIRRSRSSANAAFVGYMPKSASVYLLPSSSENNGTTGMDTQKLPIDQEAESLLTAPIFPMCHTATGSGRVGMIGNQIGNRVFQRCGLTQYVDRGVKVLLHSKKVYINTAIRTNPNLVSKIQFHAKR